MCLIGFTLALRDDVLHIKCCHRSTNECRSLRKTPGHQETNATVSAQVASYSIMANLSRMCWNNSQRIEVSYRQNGPSKTIHWKRVHDQAVQKLSSGNLYQCRQSRNRARRALHRAHIVRSAHNELFQRSRVMLCSKARTVILIRCNKHDNLVTIRTRT